MFDINTWRFFKPKELITLRCTCKKIKEDIDAHWNQRFGVSRKIFANIYLNSFPLLRMLILNENIDVLLAEKINNMLKKPYIERGKELLPTQQLHTIPKMEHVMILSSDNGILALMSGKLTLEDLAGCYDLGYLFALISNNGTTALLKNKITMKQAIAMPISYLKLILSDEQIQALISDKITPEQAAKEPTESSLRNKLTAITTEESGNPHKHQCCCSLQ